MSKYSIHTDLFDDSDDAVRVVLMRGDNEQAGYIYELPDELVEEYNRLWNRIREINEDIIRCERDTDEARRKASRTPICYDRHPDAKYDMPPELTGRVDLVDSPLPTMRVIHVGMRSGTAIKTERLAVREGIDKPCIVYTVVMGPDAWDHV